MKRCQSPPDGWYCTRDAGHSGPCAAHRLDDVIPLAKIILQDETFYVEARVGSENHRGECCRAVFAGSRMNEPAERLILLLAAQVARDNPG